MLRNSILEGSTLEYGMEKSTEEAYRYFIANLDAACFRYFRYSDGTDGISFLNQKCESIWGVSKSEARP